MPAELIKSKLNLVPETSGVYQFFDAKDQILYVGKAKNLHKRITSYTRVNQLSARIGRMVFLTQKLEFIQTQSELEALLLEHNLIKKLLPRFNILLRDGKTFPQILITNHDFPQITKFRGEKSSKGKYFGPYASNYDVHRAIEVLRKAFLLRNCSDSEFKSRKKPCLEYQIKRCSAPCVKLISSSEYQSLVDNAVNFLSGKSAEVQRNLEKKMQQLSENLEYEKAATLRDQIKSLNSIQAKQGINVNEVDDADIVALTQINEMICAYVTFFRSGQNLGSKPYFYEIDSEKTKSEFLAEFLGQFYLSQIPPNLLLLNCDLEEKNLMQEFLSEISGKKTEIILPKKGAKFALVKDQEKLALQNLEQKISQNLNTKELLLEVKKIFDLERMPKKIEVYDNSHTATTNAVGAMIAAGVDGFIKNGYRKFNIRFDMSENRDDTTMMREVLFRRFSKLQKEEYPDLIILDGGKPQLNAASEIFTELKIKIPFIAMSKGENRNAGEEYFHQIHKESFTLPKQNPAMYYLQRLRDEAHRFAITNHRNKRNKAQFD
jgi:excinuclease ABC subunit C